MIAVDQVLISDSLGDTYFACQLAACKGACCVEGDEGAPLEPDEAEFLRNHFQNIKPFLSDEGIAAIELRGHSAPGKRDKYKTTLVQNSNGACAYAVVENGIAHCGIERAFHAGAIELRKPISCHLYPVRITEHEGFEAVNYERWDICSPACINGTAQKIPLLQFVKPALVRKYGAQFFEKLEGALRFRQDQAASK
jgi:hypothetical protein